MKTFDENYDEAISELEKEILNDKNSGFKKNLYNNQVKQLKLFKNSEKYIELSKVYNDFYTHFFSLKDRHSFDLRLLVTKMPENLNQLIKEIKNLPPKEKCSLKEIEIAFSLTNKEFVQRAELFLSNEDNLALSFKYDKLENLIKEITYKYNVPISYAIKFH